MMRDVAVVLPFLPGSVREARVLVREQGRDLPEAVVDDAELLVSEVVTNAIRHGGPDIQLEVAVRDRALVIRVSDGGAGMPAVTPFESGLDEPSGRGLRMVELLAVDWGVERRQSGSGKTVWFRVADAVAHRHERVGVTYADDVEGGTRWS
jgi:anti-sigma regulatory factor (Ser/Thr protein kinase)